MEKDLQRNNFFNNLLLSLLSAPHSCSSWFLIVFFFFIFILLPVLNILRTALGFNDLGKMNNSRFVIANDSRRSVSRSLLFFSFLIAKLWNINSCEFSYRATADLCVNEKHFDIVLPSDISSIWFVFNSLDCLFEWVRNGIFRVFMTSTFDVKTKNDEISYAAQNSLIKIQQENVFLPNFPTNSTFDELQNCKTFSKKKFRFNISEIRMKCCW